MSQVSTIRFSDCRVAADYILKQFPKNLSLATPLGLGKPINLLNFIYDQTASSPDRTLEIYTALSLLKPKAKSDVERRFLKPFLDRQFGRETPQLHYAEAMSRNDLPSNIRVHEFYFQAGQYLHRPMAQASYMSVNYTHAARAIYERGIDVIVQMISRNPKNPNEYSLSCNPDVTLDLAELHGKAGKPLAIFAVIHPDLPFIGGDAIVPESFFHGLIDDPKVKHELFALPRTPIDATDHMIGLHASQLIKDDGTLQIGIGSLSDAVVHSTLLRHRANARYRTLVRDIAADTDRKPREGLHHDIFNDGLYGTSEMVMDAFMHLRQAGILKRFIFDQDEKKMRYLHGAFFLGTKVFYQWLRSLEGADFDGFSMTKVSKVNDLYDPQELALRRQRKNARFFNTCMKVSILGGVVSETLESGEVVSGVGGQYNFVAMSQELGDSHSVLMLRSTRTSDGKRRSNIVVSQPHETIPRHLRDIVVTEYGIACLRGCTDEEVIRSLIEISDVEFQDDLVKMAKANGKLRRDYRVPDRARSNTPQKIKTFMDRNAQDFPKFPFGSDFTESELKLAGALTNLQAASPWGKIRTLMKGVRAEKSKHARELERMDVWPAKGFKEKALQTLLAGALETRD